MMRQATRLINYNLAKQDYHIFKNIILLGDMNKKLNSMMHIAIRKEEVTAAILIFILRQVCETYKIVSSFGKTHDGHGKFFGKVGQFLEFVIMF